MKKISRILAEEGIVSAGRSAAQEEVELTLTLQGNPDLMKRLSKMLRAIQMLGSVGATRGVYIAVDGDGTDRLKVKGLEDIELDIEEKLEEDTLRF